MQKVAFSAHHLTVNYDKTAVLWDVSFSVPPGLLVGIIGPNGAGKSTLIKAALDIVKPLSGKIEFFESPLKKERQKIAYVPQRESVDWDFPVTVRDLVVMGRYGRLGLFHRPRAADYAAADYYLELVGMSGYLKRQISQLSGGQQQRVFLARALLQEADIYFMDEPFAGVDAATEMTIVQLLQQLRDEGKTIFVVHHDLSTVESYFDWVILLNMRLIACGPISDCFTPQLLKAAFGKSDSLFDEALKLSEKRRSGL